MSFSSRSFKCMPINRVDLYNVYNEEDLNTLLDQYATLAYDCKKAGKPYIQSLTAGRTVHGFGDRGYNLAVHIVFNSVEDMQYYDSQDETHRALKESVRDRAAGPVVVAF